MSEVAVPLSEPSSSLKTDPISNQQQQTEVLPCSNEGRQKHEKNPNTSSKTVTTNKNKQNEGEEEDIEPERYKNPYRRSIKHHLETVATYKIKYSKLKSEDEVFQVMFQKFLEHFQKQPKYYQTLKDMKQFFREKNIKNIKLSDNFRLLHAGHFDLIRKDLMRHMEITKEEIGDGLLFEKMLTSTSNLKKQKKEGKLINQEYLKIISRNIDEIVPFSILHIGWIFQLKDGKYVRVNNLLEREEGYETTDQFGNAAYQRNLIVGNPQKMPGPVRNMYHLINGEYKEGQVQTQNVATSKNSKIRFRVTPVLHLLFSSLNNACMKLKKMSPETQKYFSMKKPDQKYKTNKQEVQEIEVYLKNISQCGYNYDTQNADNQATLKLFNLIASGMDQDEIETLCYDERVEIITRFLMARKYLNKKKYDLFVKWLKKKMEEDMKVEYLIFIDHEQDNYASLKKFMDDVITNNSSEYEKICLMSLVILESMLDYNNKDLQQDKNIAFIDYLVRKVQLYEELIESVPEPGYMWEYKMKKQELIQSVLNMKEEFVENKKEFEEWLTNDFRIKGYGSLIEKDNKSPLCCFCHCTRYNYKSENPEFQKKSDKRMEKCSRCDHYAHRGHRAEWFSKNEVCPVQNCGDRCTTSFMKLTLTK